MSAFIDSIAHVLVFIITGLVLTLGATVRAWMGARKDKKRAEADRDAWERSAKLKERAHAALEEAERASQLREVDAVAEARGGARDHFESER